MEIEEIKKKKSTQELLEFGVININKPSGPTSFDVSDFVRKKLNLRKTSHFGTLDPKVTGVLPVALNRACKLTGYFLGEDKEYVGVMRIHEDISLKEIEKIIKKKFIGEITQLPPVKSRVKRQERQREIKRFELLEIGENKKDILFHAEVEGGTYIRKLCLPKNSEVIVNNSLIRIEDVERYRLKNQKTIGFKEGQFKEFNIISKQKIESPKTIINIQTESGIPLRLTGDHPILIFKNNKTEYVEANKIRINDKIISVRKIDIISKKFDILDGLDDNFLLNGPKLKELCKNGLIREFGSIREVSKKFRIDRKQFNLNNSIWLRKKYLKLANQWGFLKGKIYEIKTEKGIKFNIRNLEFDEEMAYLMGLIASDGCVVFEKKNIRPTRIKFHNEDKKLINGFKEIHNKKFSNFKCKIKKIRENLFEIDAYNPILANICYSLGIISPKEKSDFKNIFELEEGIISSFLRGYFDGDGHAFFKIKGSGAYSNIEYSTSSFVCAKRIFILLKRLGINSRIFKQPNNGSFGDKNSLMYIIRAKEINDKRKFIEKIGATHPKKKRYLDEIKNYFKDKKLKEGNYVCEKVKKVSIEKFEEGFVYDITVDNAHNFLAEGNFVVSNCDDLGKELGIGAHMLELRRTRAGIFTEDDKIYPSINLYDLEKAAKEYENGNEEALRKIIIPAEIIIKLHQRVDVKKDNVKQILTGKPIQNNDLIKKEKREIGEIVCIFSDNKFIGMYKVINSSDVFAKAEFVMQEIRG